MSASSDTEIRLATTAEDILKVMVVRGIVFIEEQDVDWEGEIDEFEDESTHILALVDGQPAASGRLRILDDGWAKLERIAVRKKWRGQGLARSVTRKLIELANEQGSTRMKLHAQVYLEKFYNDFGFHKKGPVFDECGIDHVLMTNEAN